MCCKDGKVGKDGKDSKDVYYVWCCSTGLNCWNYHKRLSGLY